MSNIYYIIFFVALVVLELLYFRVARYYCILDHPNNRSLHEKPTIRGGGIIFYLSAALFFAITIRPSYYFIVALTLVSLVGFIDDVRSLSSVARFLVQCLAFLLIMMDLDLSAVSYFMIVIIFVVSVGALNTFNFMDGINGLTGGYGFVALASLLYVNHYKIHFIDSDFVIAIAMAVMVFCYFNFRKKAVCFAGDVGSLSIGFIIIFLLIKLMTTSGNYAFVFLLSVYGVDSVLTIIHRILRKENIFKPHKLHLFQWMVHYFKISHLQMSTAYASLQLLINIILILSLSLSLMNQYFVGICIILLLTIAYICILNRKS